MSDVAIRVEGLGKQFRIGAPERYRTLRDTLTDALTAPFRRLRNGSSRRSTGETIWALKDVSFEVKRGDVIGIIGRNGAGKSTLLKILSRITEPTTGRAEIHGRVGSLLEVGTGFHPELTGRENIYLNGAILGMKKAEIIRRFDEMVAFAEVEKFIDTPVKHYSTGMYLRLAFAVAAHLEPEILIVDEVLAVGDAAFQEKCLGKMKHVAATGRTVLFVSHNIGAVRQLCTRCVLLKNGSLFLEASASRCISEYLARPGSNDLGLQRNVRAGGAGSVAILDAQLCKDGIPVSSALFGDRLELILIVRTTEDVRFGVELQLRQSDGTPVAFASSGLAHGIEICLSRGEHVVRATLPAIRLSQSKYSIDIGLANTGVGFYDYIESGLCLSVVASPIGPKNWYFRDADASFLWDVEFDCVPNPTVSLT